MGLLNFEPDEPQDASVVAEEPAPAEMHNLAVSEDVGGQLPAPDVEWPEEFEAAPAKKSSALDAILSVPVDAAPESVVLEPAFAADISLHNAMAASMQKSAMPGSKDALFSSARTGDGNDDWGTPDWLFGFLNQNFGPFDTDACADADNSKCPSFFDKVMDGLKQIWKGLIWCNPPYSNVADWVKKAHDSVYVDQTAERVCLLVANRTETEWFHEYATKGLVFFLRTRVAFVEPKDLAPAIDKKTGLPKKRTSPTFGSMVIVFDRNIDDEKRPEIAGTRVMMAQAVDWTSFKPVKPRAPRKTKA